MKCGVFIILAVLAYGQGKRRSRSVIKIRKRKTVILCARCISLTLKINDI